MDNSLSIGGKVDQEGLAMTASAIREVFKAGFEYHQSEAVMLQALSVVRTAAKVENVSVTNCNFVGEDKSINVSPDDSVGNTTGIRRG